ncbi:unnamed protein product [Mytilus coruscus]|uniref:COL6A n=1 Tax=Mytilus coruscus TaxID=42192 RepID=A0A6J8AF80_MYTCO|nr:unnamed protein product [Mytilus coruscus]
MFISHIALVFTLIELSNAHHAEVGAPWIIPRREAHSFLTAPTRNKRSDPACNTDEPYCEANKGSCMMHNEQSREHYCGQGHTCTSTQACYLSTPCPAHYELGCTDDQCLSFPCQNGATCQDTSTSYNCQCVSGWDPATNCATDYDECQSNPCMNIGSCNDLINSFSCDCTGRYEGDVCQTDCRPGPADIVFIVDTSSSLITNVNKSLDFITEFIKRIPIGPDDFQVGVITYNFETNVLFDLDDHNTTSGMIVKLQHIKGEDAATYTLPALEKAKEMITNSSMGTRRASSYIILLYDGLSTDRNNAVNEAMLIYSIGGRIITAAVGQSISYSELLLISEKQYYTFRTSFLDDMLNYILKETVPDNCTGNCSMVTGSEVILLLDTSKNQTNEDYYQRLTAIRRTIENVLTYNPNADIGMFSYSDDVEQVFNLSWSSDIDELIAAALQVRVDTVNTTSNLSHALNHIREGNLFKSSRKLIVLFSNANWNNVDEIDTEVKLSKQQDIHTFGVAAGEDCNVDNLSGVLNDPSYIFDVEDDGYTSLESLAAITKYYNCTDDIFIKRQIFLQGSLILTSNQSYKRTLECEIIVRGVFTNMTKTKASSTSMFISHIALVFALIAPTRNKRSDPDCNTNEPYCEANKDSCMMHNEQSREHYCGLGHSCTATQACYLSTPCPVHYVLGCTDDQCLSFPCHNGATCQDTSTSYSCQCVPGWDPATNCATDYNECQSVPCLNGGSCNNLFNDFTCDCTGRYEGSVCEKDCRPGPADIVFVVDTSDSLQKGVNQSIDFINKFISKVPIGRNDFQIGVIAYNFDSTVLFDLDDYTSAFDMSSVLNTVRGEEAATYTATALRQAREEQAIQWDHVEQALQITGTQWDNKRNGYTYSNSRNCPNHLDDMYNQILKETVHTDCTDCNLKEDTQVIILLDTNGNQTIESYNDRLTATRNIIDKILSYNPSANIGMYSYSDEPEEVFSLTWSGDKDKRIAAALQIDLDNHLSSNLSHALQHLRISNQFTSLRKMVVIVSNGMWTNLDGIKKEVSYSEVHGIEVNGVVAGEDNVIENFQTVLNDPSQVFYTEDGDFRALDSLTAMTKYYVCVDNIFSTRQ